MDYGEFVSIGATFPMYITLQWYCAKWQAGIPHTAEDLATCIVVLHKLAGWDSSSLLINRFTKDMLHYVLVRYCANLL